MSGALVGVEERALVLGRSIATDREPPSTSRSGGSGRAARRTATTGQAWDAAAAGLWAAIDEYLGRALVPPDPARDAAPAESDAAGLPPHNVAPTQGRMLERLARLAGARAILEIGTLGGYSAIWPARALPPGGRLVTLEANPAYAEVARRNVERAGIGEAVEIVVGRATDSLPRLHAEGRGPFDLVFIDADKAGNPEYLRWSLALARPGTVIVADNVVRDGRIVAESDDPSVTGVRRFVEFVAVEPRLWPTAIQTVGSKGYDGFLELAPIGRHDGWEAGRTIAAVRANCRPTGAGSVAYRRKLLLAVVSSDRRDKT